ncbi:hypothetical protein [Novosphingobium sp. Leaf2]|uniref:hypothetical protein n=1 Tax=Novosphingobium sp. Leaf2 TaxID=1735670 RepID=UPI0006F73D0E|nr:hypothetical protein [Novosphingobium sp. Leaf2]KQM18377.1 hypothetical protein ASE49_09205 [Novosphingobium sp. Leaf2]
MLAEGFKGLAGLADQQDKINAVNDETQARIAVAGARQQISTTLDGFKQLKLGQARAGQQGFNETLDKIKTDVLESAKTPRQRQMIAMGLLESDGAARSMGANWALGQANEETKASFGIEQSALVDAAVASDNPAFRDNSGLQLRDSVRRQLQFEGWDEKANPTAYAVAEKAALTKMHGGVLDRMFSAPDPDIDAVGQYLGAYRDEMTGDLYTKTLARMQGPLQDRVDDYRADLIQVAPTAGNAPAAATGPWQSVAVNVAKRFGLDPADMAAVMSYETGGTFSPTIMGGKGGNYMGLIQFGPAERKKYGIDKSSSPEAWTKAVGDYLQDRGFKSGMGVMDLYSTINAGSPGRYNASDGNGTVTTHVEQILGAHKEKAKGWLGGAVGYTNAPREWDRPAIYQQIKDKALSEGWSPEVTKRVEQVWDKRMATDESLLKEQHRSADEQARTIALNAGDNFKVSMLPKAVRDNLAPVDMAEYGAAERRITEAKAKQETADRGQSATWQLEAQARFDPDGFKSQDLKKYVGVIPAAQLNTLAMKQADLASRPPKTYSEVDYRGQIQSEINFQDKHNGLKLDDRQKVAMYDYMSGSLSQVYQKKGTLTKQDVSTIFQSGMRQIPNAGGILGRSSKPVYELLTDVPDDFRQKFMSSWSGNRPPTNGDMVSAYQQWVQAGGLRQRH